ncbi:MAG: type VI secretion system baseplate subunit TssF [Polyangiaceae bacterium]|nr:type VI secretion system baseplate subunit TssF [Polyangiaceae bacterium]
MFRDLFEREANAIWGALRKLSQDDSSLERLYAIDADSRVAELVQTGAFVFASARFMLEDDDQILSRPLIAAALPSALRPRPASTIVQRTVQPVSAGELRGHMMGGPYPFEVRWPVAVAPIEVRQVRMDRLHAYQQVLRLTLGGVGGGELKAALPESVRFFVNLAPRSITLDLIHALRTAGAPIQVAAFTTDERPEESILPPSTLRWVRIDTEEPPLCSTPPDRFASGPLLGDLFSFPESFSFIEIDLSSIRRGNLDSIELTLPLARVVEGASNITREHVQLFCAPATNEFVAPIESLRASAGQSHWSLRVVGHPHAEILHVRAMFMGRTGQNERRALVSWEAPDTPHTFDPANVYYRLDQRLSPDGTHTEMHTSFATLEQFYAPMPAVSVEGEVLGSDGVAVASLGIGDISSPTSDLVNITQPSPSHRAPLGHNHATRIGAYARMPSRQFAEAVHLTEFLKLHDHSAQEHGRARMEHPQLLGTHHEREHTLVDCTLRWGDAFNVDIALGSASPGEAWLLGALLSRAIAERAEMIDFTRLTFRQRQEVFAEYPLRSGQRLPFPLG